MDELLELGKRQDVCISGAVDGFGVAGLALTGFV
jgi:hypothetical protein